MAELRIGNVIKSPGGSLWIVTAVHSKLPQPHHDTVQAVSFDSENCCATQRLDDEDREEFCSCTDGESPCYADPGCKRCDGKGFYLKKIKGWKHSQVLAPNVKEFIKRRLAKALDLEGILS